MTPRLGLGALGGQVSFYKDAASTRLPSLQPAPAGISGNNPQICHTPPAVPRLAYYSGVCQNLSQILDSTNVPP